MSTYTPHRRPVVHTYTESLPVRRGSLVLSCQSDTLGVGRVEGMSYLPPVPGFRGACEAGYVVRWADGTVDAWDALPGVLVAVDEGTLLVEDQGNNVGRHCSVRGDLAAGVPVRSWRVLAAVSGRRYLVAREQAPGVPVDDVVRVVAHGELSNLY